MWPELKGSETDGTSAGALEPQCIYRVAGGHERLSLRLDEVFSTTVQHRSSLLNHYKTTTVSALRGENAVTQSRLAVHTSGEIRTHDLFHAI